jgi:hypothetical protein
LEKVAHITQQHTLESICCASLAYRMGKVRQETPTNRMTWKTLEKRGEEFLLLWVLLAKDAQAQSYLSKPETEILTQSLLAVV